MVDESWLSQHRMGKRDSEWADSVFRVGLLNCLENVASMGCRGVPFNPCYLFLSGRALGCHCFVALSRVNFLSRFSSLYISKCTDSTLLVVLCLVLAALCLSLATLKKPPADQDGGPASI